MSHLEDQLRSALRRKDPPLGFAGRVLARTNARHSRRRLWWTTAALSAAVAAGVMVLSISTARYQQQREEQAGRQAIAALQIASEKLNLARDKALRLDVPPARVSGAESGKKDN